MSISKFLIKKNVVKNEQQANYVMIAVIAACLLFLGIKHLGGSQEEAPELTFEELQLLEQEGGFVDDPNFQ
ncbi:MAG: hypothetical protein MRY57_00585 [Candidatus Pacebacteria bacterium]|nr:hypothetical protein [Candidatus Paceibacterota bacterium]